MAALSEPRRYTEAEYLAFERASTCKHEYRQGEIVAMVGASFPHSQIAANIVGEFRTRLRGGPCQAVVNDLRIQVSAAGRYVYPDVVVVCGPPRLADTHQDTLLNPSVIFEVLSPSTEADDRGAKFQAYRTIETLQEYVLVSQTQPRVDQFTRQENGLWVLRPLDGLDATLELAVLNCTLPLREIYDRVELA